MRPEPKILWESDDVSLHQEFSDVSEAWRECKTEVKRVPAALDRRIRRHAGMGSEPDLMKSWIFGAIPKMSLAAAILFGVGIMFLSSLQLPDIREGGTGDPAITNIGVDPVALDNWAVTSDLSEGAKQAVTSLVHGDKSDGDYEIEFQFALDTERKAINATIASRCQVGDNGNCDVLGEQNTARVDQIARMLLNRRTFEAGISSAKIEVSRNQLLQE